MGMYVDLDRYEIGQLMEGAKLLRQYVQDIAESAPWDDWSSDLRDTQNLVEKMESLYAEAVD